MTEANELYRFITSTVVAIPRTGGRSLGTPTLRRHLSIRPREFGVDPHELRRDHAKAGPSPGRERPRSRSRKELADVSAGMDLSTRSHAQVTRREASRGAAVGRGRFTIVPPPPPPPRHQHCRPWQKKKSTDIILAQPRVVCLGRLKAAQRRGCVRLPDATGSFSRNLGWRP